jgi:hypothetical protein
VNPEPALWNVRSKPSSASAAWRVRAGPVALERVQSGPSEPGTRVQPPGTVWICRTKMVERIVGATAVSVSAAGVAVTWIAARRVSAKAASVSAAGVTVTKMVFVKVRAWAASVSDAGVTVRALALEAATAASVCSPA